MEERNCELFISKPYLFYKPTWKDIHDDFSFACPGHLKHTFEFHMLQWVQMSPSWPDRWDINKELVIANLKLFSWKNTSWKRRRHLELKLHQPMNLAVLVWLRGSCMRMILVVPRNLQRVTKTADHTLSSLPSFAAKGTKRRKFCLRLHETSIVPVAVLSDSVWMTFKMTKMCMYHVTYMHI